MQGPNTFTGIPSIDSLHKEKGVKENSKIEIFKTVLNKCVEKIVYTNRHTDKTFVIFEVPKILIGYPSYDMKMCILFLINQLSKKSYYVAFIEPFYLYIDWGTVNGSQSKNFNIIENIRTNNPKLKQQTKELLEKFPDTTKVEFVYEDLFKQHKNSSKHGKKNNKRK
jgi:hypothetical protein